MRKPSVVLLAISLSVSLMAAGCGEREFHQVESYSSESTPLTDEGREAISSCVGKSASEAKDVAEEHGCEAKFFDPYGTGLTDEMGEESKGEAIRTSTVTDVEIHESLLFDNSVWFTLSYVDASNEAQEPNRKLVEACADGSPLDALSTAREVDYSYVFKDSDGTDVTDVVDRARDGSVVSKSTVEKAVVEKGIFGGYSAVYTISYSDNDWLSSLEGESVDKVCKEFERESSGAYYLVAYPERMHQEKPTLSNIGKDQVVMQAERDDSGLRLTVVLPEYIETENALNEKLPVKKAKKAAKKYVKKLDGIYGVHADYAEAIDEDTWLISGTCSQDSGIDELTDSYGEFTVKVTGTKRKPVVGDFEFEVTMPGEWIDDSDWDW